MGDSSRSGNSFWEKDIRLGDSSVAVLANDRMEVHFICRLGGCMKVRRAANRATDIMVEKWRVVGYKKSYLCRPNETDSTQISKQQPTTCMGRYGTYFIINRRKT